MTDLKDAMIEFGKAHPAPLSVSPGLMDAGLSLATSARALSGKFGAGDLAAIKTARENFSLAVSRASGFALNWPEGLALASMVRAFLDGAPGEKPHLQRAIGALSAHIIAEGI